MRWYMIALRNHLGSSTYGRAGRRESWVFQLVNGVIAGAFAAAVAAVTHWRQAAQGGQAVKTASTAQHVVVALLVLYLFVMFFPSLTTAVRRLHDTGRSGLYLLLWGVPFGFIWLLTFWAEQGQAGDNQYGPDPRAAVTPARAEPQSAGSARAG